MTVEARLLPRTAAGRRDLVGCVAFGLVVTAVVVGQSALLSRCVEAVFMRGAGLRQLGPTLVALLAAAAVRSVSQAAADMAGARAAARVRLDLRDRLARARVRLAPAQAGGQRSGEIVHALVAGIEATDAYVAQYLPQLALAVLAPAFVLFVALTLDPLSGLVMAVTYPLIPLFTYLIGSAAREQTQRQWRVLSQLSGTFLESIQCLATLKAFGRSDERAEQLGAACERFRVLTMAVLKLALVSALALEFLATLGTALIAVEVGLRLLYGRLAFARSLFLILLAPEFYRPLRAFGAAFHAGMAGREAAIRVFDAMPARDSEPSAGRQAPPRPPFDVEFAGVRFSYAEGRAAALDGLDLTLAAGTTLALVGPNGSGKTTTLRLLLRFLDPQAGVIRIGGLDLATIDPVEWRRRVGWVPQRPHLFHGSVGDNIRMGRPEATLDEVVAAAKLASAHEFIERLPEGYATAVGEAGARLSGGEAQRVALARAFLRDSPLLILDEPTAHLDVENAAQFDEILGRLRCNRSVLLIAHRLSSVKAADRVAVLERGRCLETGSPVQLAGAGGAFARLAAPELGP